MERGTKEWNGESRNGAGNQGMERGIKEWNGHVSQGFTQQEGEDYDEIFAHVAKYHSIRSVLAMAN